MQVAAGKSVQGGVAVGPLRVYRREETPFCRFSSLTPAEEWARFRSACGRAREELAGLCEKARDELGEDNAAIFEIHRMMLEDEDYLDAVKDMTGSQSATAEYAVRAAGERFSAAFAAMEDEYMQARAADVMDVSRRVADILTGRRDAFTEDGGPAILAADDLSPSETVQLDRSRLLGLVLRREIGRAHV